MSGQIVEQLRTLNSKLDKIISYLIPCVKEPQIVETKAIELPIIEAKAKKPKVSKKKTSKEKPVSSPK